MPETYRTKPLILFLLFVSLFCAIYVGLVALGNGTFFEVRMQVTDGREIHPRLYYRTAKQPFSQKMSSAAVMKAGWYSMPIRSKDPVAQYRFDPDIKKGRKITLSAMRIRRVTWWKEYVWTVPPGTFEKIDQIEPSTFANRYPVTFTTTGYDAKIYLHPPQSKPLVKYRIEVEKFFWALFFTLTILFFLQIYRQRSSEESFWSKTILYTLFLGFILFQACYDLTHIRYGYPPDEGAHYRYAMEMHYAPALVPDFTKMHHYLTHPPLYYIIIGQAFDPNRSQLENVQAMRQVTFAIFALSVLLLLMMGYEAKWGVVGHFVFLSFLASIPMFTYLGGSLSNDNLALLAGTLFLVGLKRLLPTADTCDATACLLIVSGGVIGFFTKLTVAILIFFALLYFILYRLLKRAPLHLAKWQWFLLASAVVVVLYYQINILLTYHGLIPTYDKTHPQAFLHSPFYVPPESRLHLSLKEWFGRMLHYIQGGWFGIHSHHSFGHATWWGVWGSIFLHLLAIFGLFLPCPKEENDRSLCLLGKVGLLAFFSVETVQFFFSYKAHLKNGYLGGLQPRYLLPFMVSFAILSSFVVDKLKRFFIWNVMVLIATFHALYGSFFYFLLFYR